MLCLFPACLLPFISERGKSSSMSNCVLTNIPSALLQKRWVSLAVMLGCPVSKTVRWEKSMTCNLVSNGPYEIKTFLDLPWELMSEQIMHKVKTNSLRQYGKSKVK